MQQLLRVSFFALLAFGCTNEQQKKHPQEAFFYNPSQLCRALEISGVATNSWRPSPALNQEWFCQSGTIALSQPRGFNPASSFVYRVTGDSRESVFAVSLRMTLFSPKDEEQAFTFLEKVINDIFKTIKKPVPNNLVSQVRQKSRFTLETPYAVILMNNSGETPKIIEWILFKRSYIIEQKTQATHLIDQAVTAS